MKGLIDKHYQHYLKLAKLNESEMHDIQRIETKRAFVAGMTEIFSVLMEGLPLGTTLNDYKEELKQYHENEIKNSTL
jgi:hypothetical protein